MQTQRNKRIEILAGAAMLLGGLGFGVANNMSVLDLQSATLTVMLRATPIILVLSYVLFTKVFAPHYPEAKNRIFVGLFCVMFFAGLIQALCMGYNKYGTQAPASIITSTIMDSGYTMSKNGRHRNYYVVVAHPMPEQTAERITIGIRTEDATTIRPNQSKIRYPFHEGALGFPWVAYGEYEVAVD